MQNNEERENKVNEKAEFYFQEKLDCHVPIIPSGFRNGKFDSNLIDKKYYWFIDYRNDERKRLFLAEIYDIEDYKEEVRNEH